MPANIPQQLAQVQQAIAQAESKAHRAVGSVLLVAVSKQQPITKIRAAYTAGQRHFAENYWQEAEEKIIALADLAICWHFIGAIQRNKTAGIAEKCDWVHSVSRLTIAKRLNAQRPPDRPPLNVCVQVNISDESTKSGVAPEATLALLTEIAALPRLRLRGLMTLPRPTDDLIKQRNTFEAVAALQTWLIQETGLPLDSLSMGMSNDYQAAIAAGSTVVRVGTAIFGQRGE